MSSIELGPGALDDPAIPDFVGVSQEQLMRIFGWTNRTTIAKNIGKRIPPSHDDGRNEWTIGQLRDWRIRRGLLANRKAERLAEECAKLASRETALEQAALSLE